MKAVVIGYPHQWHWVLSAEYALRRTNEKIIIFDFSSLGLISIQHPNWPFSANWKFRRRVIRYLSSMGIPVVSRKHDFGSQLKSIVLALIARYPLVIDHKTILFNSIYPSLVNYLDDTRVISAHHRFKIRVENAKAILMRKRLKEISNYRVRSLVTVNGRFTNNYEVRVLAEAEGLDLSFLEFGSSKNKLEEYFVSPHSFFELAQKMRNLWHGLESEKQIGDAFFKELSGFDRVAGVSWTKNMVSGELPLLTPGRKLCVFYASSQKEFVGVGDETEETHFQTQFDAFEALHAELSADENWDFIIRRHPNAGIPSQDADGYYWEKFKNCKNTFFIEPNSSVDSYALGLKANLVAHYNSSIGAQLIYAGHGSVLTMGNAMWAELVPETLGRSIKELKFFLQRIEKSWEPESVLPWAHFRATFGSEFKFFDFVSDKTTWKIKNYES